MGVFDHGPELVKILWSPGLVNPGDVLTGTVEVNLPLMKKKEVTKIVIGLHAKLKTRIDKEEGEAHIVHGEELDLVRIDQPLWDHSAPLYPADPSGEHARLPFQFIMPHGELPPSFHVNGHRIGVEYEGSVVYYLHVKASREGWFHRDGRVDYPFGFVPTERFDPRTPVSLEGFNGPWQVYAGDEDMKKNLFAHHGHAHLEIQVPQLAQLPLFVPIPVRIRIVCTSKPLKSDELADFDFPRMPTLDRVAFTIRQQCNVSARGLIGDSHELSDDRMAIAGFGELSATSDAVSVFKGQPTWAPESPGNPKGRWSEDVMLTTWVTFQNPPPFETQYLKHKIFLEVNVDFPGLGHHAKVVTLALPIQAAPKQPPAPPPQWNGFQGTLQLPPRYWNYTSGEE